MNKAVEQTLAPDIYIVQKQTILERYSRPSVVASFKDYLEHDEHSTVKLTEAHNSHINTRDLLLKSLNAAGLSYTMLSIDELLSANIPYFQVDGSGGLKPRLGIVIALGGDGTLLHASHYCGNEVALIGINSCPSQSVGHLCALSPKDLPTLGENLGALSRLNFRKVSRLLVESSSRQKLPLALNDVLFCHKHPPVMSRYQIDLISHKKPEENISERHHSSGVWVATPAGSTAAIRGYGLPVPELTSESFLFAVRELYPRPNRSYSLCRRYVESAEYSLSFLCRMRQGMIWMDGSDACAELGLGDCVTISIPRAAQLRLLMPTLRN